MINNYSRKLNAPQPSPYALQPSPYAPRLVRGVQAFALALCLPFAAYSETFTAGKDYQQLNVTPSVKSKAVTVTEYFSYGCPWCYKLEEPLEAWRKKQGSTITFTRVPVIFHDEWETYAKAYYFLTLTKQEADISPKLFLAIQKDKKPLGKASSMIDYLTTLGLDKSTLESGFFHSTTMDYEIKQGITAMTQNQIQSVPAIIINNQYKIDIQMAGSIPRFFEIANYLVKKSQ